MRRMGLIMGVVRSRGDFGFGEGLPAMIVSEAFHGSGWVLDAVDRLGGCARVGDDVEPVTVLQLLGRCELGLGQSYTAVPPGCADGLYFDVALDFAGGVAGFNVVAF